MLLLQGLGMESMFLLRTDSGTNHASSAHAALWGWWAPASSLTVTWYCAQTATTTTDGTNDTCGTCTRCGKNVKHCWHQQRNFQTSALHMNTAVLQIHSQCTADTKLSIYGSKPLSAFSTVKCLYKFCINVLLYLYDFFPLNFIWFAHQRKNEILLTYIPLNLFMKVIIPFVARKIKTSFFFKRNISICKTAFLLFLQLAVCM